MAFTACLCINNVYITFSIS